MDPLISAGVALITGSGSGIGQAIANNFAGKGCTKIFLVDISESGLQETRDLLQKRHKQLDPVTFKADVSVAKEVQAMVAACVQKFRRIDFVANNAGITAPPAFTVDQDLSTFETVLRVNTKSIFLCHKYQIAQMLKQDPLKMEGVRHPPRGSIVNTASLLGLGVQPQMAPYNSSKHAVVSMSRCDAREFASQGIRVNCVCPGIVDTPMARKANLDDEWIKKQSPMGRMADAEEVAEAVTFLSGAGATAITGISMPVDTGSLLYLRI